MSWNYRSISSELQEREYSKHVRTELITKYV